MKGSVRKRGKRWYYNFYHEGKRIERAGGNTRKEALESLRKALDDIDKYNKLQDGSMRYSELLKIWIEEYVEINCRSTTKNRYVATIKNHIAPALGNRALKDIRPNLIQNFANKLSKKYSRGTALNILGVVKSSLSYAVHPGDYIRISPADNVFLPKESIELTKKKKPVTLDLDEVIDFMNSFEEFSIHKTLIMLGLYTGARRGEVLALNWSDVDLENCTITIEQSMYRDSESGRCELGPLKNSSSYRTIMIPNPLLRYLKALKLKQSEDRLRLGEYYIKNDFVAKRNDGSNADYDTVTYLSQKARRNDWKFSFKSLRHLHATILLQEGANIKTIQERLGHASARMTLDTYAHSTRKAETEAMNILNSKLPLKNANSGRNSGN